MAEKSYLLESDGVFAKHYLLPAAYEEIHVDGGFVHLVVREVWQTNTIEAEYANGEAPGQGIEQHVPSLLLQKNWGERQADPSSLLPNMRVTRKNCKQTRMPYSPRLLGTT